MWSKLPQCWVSSCEICIRVGTFGFEDINGQLMKMIHGTGDITLQLFHMKEIHNTVSSLDFRRLPAGSCLQYIKSMSDKLRPWKILATANNCCKVIGPSQSLTSQYPEEIKGMISTATDNSIKKDLRIVQHIKIKLDKIYAKGYTQMNKRICYIVLLNDSRIAEILSFIWNSKTCNVYALVGMFHLENPCFLFDSAGTPLDQGKTN